MKNYKKVRLLLPGFLSVALLFSCTSSPPPSPSHSQPPAPPSSPIVTPSQEPGPSADETVSYELTGGKLIDSEPVTHEFSNAGLADLHELFKEPVIVRDYVQHTDDAGNPIEGSDIYYYIYDPQMGQKREIGHIESWDTSSGDEVIMGGYYYYSTSLRTTPYQLFVGFSLDGGERKIVENDQTYYPPFQHFSKLSETEFTVHGPQAIGDIVEEKVTDYYIRIYNTETGEYKEIVRVRYDGDLQKGEGIISICCDNDKVYAYFTERGGQNEEFRDFIKIYDRDGELMETRPAQNIDSDTVDDTVWEIEVYGDYLIIDTLNEHILVYKYENGAYRKVNTDKLPEWCILYRESEGSDKNGYLFLLDNDGFDISRTKFYILDVYGEDIYQVENKLDEQCPYVTSIRLDPEGNLLITVSSSMDTYDENTVIKYYYISREEWQSCIGKNAA